MTEEILNEYNRCREDIVYFYEKYMRANGEAVTLTDEQKIVLREMANLLHEPERRFSMPGHLGDTGRVVVMGTGGDFDGRTLAAMQRMFYEPKGYNLIDYSTPLPPLVPFEFKIKAQSFYREPLLSIAKEDIPNTHQHMLTCHKKRKKRKQSKRR